MKTLHERLSGLESDRTMWISPGGLEFTVAELKALRNEVFPSVGSLRGRRLALVTHDSLELGWLLFCLDGEAAQITLLPGSLKSHETQAVIQESNSEFIVHCHPSPSMDSLDIPWTQIPLPSKVMEERSIFPRESHDPNDQGRVFQTVDSYPTRWLLATSGTMGRPKLVSHTLESLTCKVKSDQSRGKSFRWGSLYELSSFAGLQVFLQSWFAGSPFLFERNTDSIAAKIDRLIQWECNALSATPSMWRILLMSTNVSSLQLKQLTLGGEAVDQRLLDILRRTFPHARIVHIYASTEAGVGFTVSDGCQGFPVHYLDSPPSGIKLKVGEDGRLLIKPNHVPQRYVSEDLRLCDDQGFIDTGDIVRRQGNRFLFCGRQSGVINVGGRKVHPWEVENVLLDHPSVSLARVSARKSSILGSLIHAEVTLQDAADQLTPTIRQSLVQHCRNRLEPYQVPASIRVAREIGLSANGKLVRQVSSDANGDNP